MGRTHVAQRTVRTIIGGLGGLLEQASGVWSCCQNRHRGLGAVVGTGIGGLELLLEQALGGLELLSEQALRYYL